MTEIKPDKIIIVDNDPLPKGKDWVYLYLTVDSMTHHLVELSGNTKLPPIKGHFIFPTPQEEYAIKQATTFGGKDKFDSTKFVLKIKVRRAYISMQVAHAYGGESYQEYWLARSEIDRFNKNIDGITTYRIVKNDFIP
jgi:hypothetical protein